MGRLIGALKGRPRFLAFLVLALTLGPLGVRAVFGVLDRLYLRPLPYRDPAQVVAIYPANPYLNEDFGFLPIKYARWRESAKSLTSISAYRWENVELDAGTGHTDTARAGRVTASLFRTLGVSAAHGRVLQDEDCRPGAGPVAALSYEYWRKRFAADPAAVGRKLEVDGIPHTIVGVLPKDFWFVLRKTPVWLPLSTDFEVRSILVVKLNSGQTVALPNTTLATRGPLVQVVGRLKPGATVPEVRNELRQLARQTRPVSVRDHLSVAPLGSVLRRYLHPALLFPAGFFGLTVLVALVQVWRLYRRGVPKDQLHSGLIFWAFFVGKSLLGLAVISGVWILVADPSSDLRITATYQILAVLWVFWIICCGFVYWSWRDQRVRCRVCLRRLRVPFTTGTWSSSLLNRPTTEYLCPAGHGSLWVADMDVTGTHTAEWTDMDDAWRDLFARR